MPTLQHLLYRRAIWALLHAHSDLVSLSASSLSQRASLAGAAHATRGNQLFQTTDLKCIQALVRGEHTISGFSSRLLQRYLHNWTSGKISRIIRRFKAHRLIKRVKKPINTTSPNEHKAYLAVDVNAN